MTDLTLILLIRTNSFRSWDQFCEPQHSVENSKTGAAAAMLNMEKNVAVAEFIVTAIVFSVRTVVGSEWNTASGQTN